MKMSMRSDGPGMREPSEAEMNDGLPNLREDDAPEPADTPSVTDRAADRSAEEAETGHSQPGGGSARVPAPAPPGSGPFAAAPDHRTHEPLGAAEPHGVTRGSGTTGPYAILPPATDQPYQPGSAASTGEFAVPPAAPTFTPVAAPEPSVPEPSVGPAAPPEASAGHAAAPEASSGPAALETSAAPFGAPEAFGGPAAAPGSFAPPATAEAEDDPAPSYGEYQPFGSSESSGPAESSGPDGSFGWRGFQQAASDPGTGPFTAVEPYEADDQPASQLAGSGAYPVLGAPLANPTRDTGDLAGSAEAVEAADTGVTDEPGRAPWADATPWTHGLEFGAAPGADDAAESGDESQVGAAEAPAESAPAGSASAEWAPAEIDAPEIGPALIEPAPIESARNGSAPVDPAAIGPLHIGPAHI